MSDIFGWLGPAIIAVGFLAAAAAYLRGSTDKGTIASLQASHAAAEIREADDAKEITKLRTQLDAVTQANRVLINTVTAAAEIQALSGQLGEHHTEAMEAWAEIRSTLEQVKQLLAALEAK